LSGSETTAAGSPLSKRRRQVSPHFPFSIRADILQTTYDPLTIILLLGMLYPEGDCGLLGKLFAVKTLQRPYF
jgi:hypothetical protein